MPAGYTWRWAGEYEFQLRAKERLKVIVPIVFFIIFLLLYMVFKSAIEALVLIFPTLYAMSGGLLLQWLMGYNFSVAVWVGYIALFGIAVETGVVRDGQVPIGLTCWYADGVGMVQMKLREGENDFISLKLKKYMPGK